MWGECISGALYWNDFVNLAKKVGFGDPRLVSDAPITIKNKEIEAKCEGIEFYSATYRLFKLECLEVRMGVLVVLFFCYIIILTSSLPPNSPTAKTTAKP